MLPPSPLTRSAVLAAKLHDLQGFAVRVDCGTPGCLGERTYRVEELAGWLGRWRTMDRQLRRLRCRRCGRPLTTAWLTAPPALDSRFLEWEVPLLGPEAES